MDELMSDFSQGGTKGHGKYNEQHKSIDIGARPKEFVVHLVWQVTSLSLQNTEEIEPEKLSAWKYQAKESGNERPWWKHNSNELHVITAARFACPRNEVKGSFSRETELPPGKGSSSPDI